MRCDEDLLAVRVILQILNHISLRPTYTFRSFSYLSVSLALHVSKPRYHSLCLPLSLSVFLSLRLHVSVSLRFLPLCTSLTLLSFLTYQAPDILNRINMCSVDYVARAIVQGTADASCIGKCFHVWQPQS